MAGARRHGIFASERRGDVAERCYKGRFAPD
jgi:hypothetical protein